MSYYAPVYRKIIHSNDVFIERVLPNNGNIRVKVGDMVEAFSEIGRSKHSIYKFDIDSSLSSNLFPGKSYSTGDFIGKVKGKSITAPFGGFLEKSGDSFSLVSQKETYTLLSGVWGEIVDQLEGLSVLVKTQMTDVHLIACTNDSVEGELVVFPNPSVDMQMQYLKKYHKNVFKKIIYVGDTFQEELLEKAAELNVSGILAGCATRELFATAKKLGIFLGIFSGFGYLTTAREVFTTLTNVSNRYVFLRGSENLLRIPMPEPFDKSMGASREATIKPVKKGVKVIVFSEDHFGWIGFVEKAGKNSIVVKFVKNDASVAVPLPNMMVLV